MIERNEERVFEAVGEQPSRYGEKNATCYNAVHSFTINRGRQLQEPEVDFDGRDHRHCFAIFQPRLESPLRDCINRFLIQTES